MSDFTLNISIPSPTACISKVTYLEWITFISSYIIIFYLIQSNNQLFLIPWSIFEGDNNHPAFLLGLVSSFSWLFLLKVGEIMPWLDVFKHYYILTSTMCCITKHRRRERRNFLFYRLIRHETGLLLIDELHTWWCVGIPWDRFLQELLFDSFVSD